jgi:tetratricopeptide (TPR) repeat protein
VFTILSEASLALRSGRLIEAEQLLGDVLDLEPDHLSARIDRGRTRMNLGQLGPAMSDFQRAQDVSPDSAEPLTAMGDLYFGRKDYLRAVSCYDQALDLQPGHAMALCRRGVSHHSLGRPGLALEDLEQAQTLDPQIPSIGRYVAMVRGTPGSR